MFKVVPLMLTRGDEPNRRLQKISAKEHAVPARLFAMLSNSQTFDLGVDLGEPVFPLNDLLGVVPSLIHRDNPLVGAGDIPAKVVFHLGKPGRQQFSRLDQQRFRGLPFLLGRQNRSANADGPLLL